MTKRFSLTAKQWFWLLAGLVAVSIVYGVAVRAYNLGFPNKQVFDEVYFPTFAQHYIDGVSFYDVHPPFGKFVIAIGMFILGDNPIGWRSMPLLFGIGIIGLMTNLWWAIFKDKVGALILAFLVAIDGIFIVYSRTGLMDGVLFFFTFVTFLAGVRAQSWWRLFWLGTLLGLSVAIKWPSLALMVPIIYYGTKNKRLWHLIFPVLWAAVVYFAVVVAGQLLIHDPHPFKDGYLWNMSAGDYHLNLKATHPWGSPWWSWPFLLKPVLFLYDAVAGGKLQVEYNIGNPLVWLASTGAVLGTVGYLLGRWVQEKVSPFDHPLMPFLLAYFAFLLPWIPIHRVVFLYHYLPAYGFALCMLTYWLVEWWKKQPAAVLAALLLCFVVSAYELPLAVGWIPLTNQQVQARIFWIDTNIK